jgi:CRISPR-associated protein Csm1
VDAWRIYDLTGEPSTGNRDPLVAPRLLARHTPSGLDFDAIAEKSTGAPYLGVLKMDADQLGQAINRVLVKARDFSPLKEFSDKLDRFFASRLDRELSKDEWSDIYTVFSGGDDLLLVGPWDTLFQYAGHVQKLFSDLFHAYGLTISAGMAVVTRKHPIRRAVEQAEDLLERAKREAAPGASEGRDQFSAFGQIWKWKEHDGIVHNAKCLTNWVTGNTAERGWLHTLLRLAEEQKAQHLSSARLAYHIARNYPRSTDNDPNKQALRRWIDQIAQDFEKKERLETRYLPVIVRYALTATRARTGG